MRDKKHDVIYIGKAKKLKNRVSSYFRDTEHLPKVEKMVSLVEDFDYIVTDSEFEALILECSMIKQYMPKYNILLKDDKGFSYIRVSKEPYPRITAELQKHDDGAEYIGPYISSFGVKRMVETAVTAFRLPTCQKKFPDDFGKGRPCLNSHIGLCMAVCSGRVSKEQYAEAVSGAVFMLTKGTNAILKKLEEDMYAASERLEFERAARFRDSINSIKKMEDRQKVIKSDTKAQIDVFAFAADDRSVCAVVLKFRNGMLHDKDEQLMTDTTDIEGSREEFIDHYYIYNDDIPSRVLCDAEFESMEALAEMLTKQKGKSVAVSVPKIGENRSLVEMAYTNAIDRLKRNAGRKSRQEQGLAELTNILGLKKVPFRIEAYDISNYGDDAVAGMTVIENGVFKKSDYRRFIIKTVEGIDDYASMSEVISRRIKRYDELSPGFKTKPDLILLDGGKGHLSAITECVRGTSFGSIPMFGMVKDSKHRTRGIVGHEGELSVSVKSGAFAFLTELQDETHRYTITYQRRRHSKKALQSQLLEIKGVGPKKAALLLDYFKNIEAISKASQAEIGDIQGIDANTAAEIYRYFNS